MAVKYVGMFLVTALAGIASGLLWLIPNGLMGGALGMSLAGGAIWLGRRQQKQDGKLTRGEIVATGVVCGFLGGVLMAIISQACAGIRATGEAAMFGPPQLPLWAPVVMGVLYGVVVQWTYATRLSSQHPLTAAMFWTCLGCFALKTVTAPVYYLGYLGPQDKIDAGSTLAVSAMLAALGAVPFALLWVLAMRWTDPAWERAGAKTITGANQTRVAGF